MKRTKTMKKFLAVLGVIVVLIVAVLAYYGAFTPVVISEKKMGPFQLVYEKHIGDYKESGTVIDRVYQNLKNDSVETARGFGLYYDDPAQVETAKLRSIVGCIPDDTGKVRELMQKYNVREYPASNCVVAEFPYRGTISIILGIIKVYPVLGKYMNDKSYAGGPIMEIYDPAGKKVYYICSLDIDMKVLNSFLEVK